MLRRTFLTGAAGAGLLPLAAGGTHAAPEAVHLARSYVVGTAYTDAGKVAARLAVGSDLTLRRDSDNPFDPRTIDVYAGTVRLGSLPGKDSRILANMMDAGIRITAAVHAVAADREKPKIELDLAMAERLDLA